MKILKKIIFLIIIVVIFISYNFYNYMINQDNIISEEKIFFNVEENTISDELNKIILHITGEVKSQGVIQVPEGSRLIDVIEAAGGFTEFADVNKINLAYVVQDGQKINIPNVNTVEKEDYITKNIGENIIVEDINTSNGLININTATQTELETLTGVGASTALKIIKYRQENGKFKTIEDIKNVPGIGETKFEVMKDEICV